MQAGEAQEIAGAQGVVGYAIVDTSNCSLLRLCGPMGLSCGATPQQCLCESGSFARRSSVAC